MGLGLRVQGFGFRIEGLGFRVEGGPGRHMLGGFHGRNTLGGVALNPKP